MNLKESVSSLGKDLLGVALLLVFLLLFFNIEKIKDSIALSNLPDTMVNVNTIFISIIIEAFPFILLGVFVSALIQIYVSEDKIQKFLPKNALAALLPAALLGAIFPICECAIVPVVRRLIKKGMPLHVGVVFLVGAPILNPVVFASTFYAFRNNPTVLYSRMGLAFILAILIGAIMYFIFRNKTDQLKWSKEELMGKQVTQVVVPTKKSNRFKQTMYHAADEFFMMGKYLIAGAFIAALFQTLLDRSLLQALGSNEYSATFVMMAFAYVLSLCSEADAFVAASFANNFTTSSIIAFLVYGPMIDLKNTIMLLAFFKTKFVLVFIATVTISVFGSVLLLNFFIL
ncbi:permease [Bacillaceae bacterium IKA-2]|nr:permease [Bacillaceae bacterium IKA-2]